MARFRKMRLGALNIILQPHSPELYINLFRKLYALKRAVKYYGEKGGALAYFKNFDERNPNVFYGELYTFTNIDPRRPWLDGINLAPLTNENGDPVPQVSEDLKPNLRRTFFIFYPDFHRLVFDARSISPQSACKLLSGLLSIEEITQEFGPVEVIVESSTDAIERILRIPTLSKLTIKTVRPNPDEIAGPEAEADVYQRMEEQGLYKHEQIMTSRRGESINPNRETKRLMMVSVSNGEVKAEGYTNDDKKIVESTNPHPNILTAFYDPDVDSFLNMMLVYSRDLIQKIRGNNN